MTAVTQTSSTTGVVRRALMALIRLYQLVLSPVLVFVFGPACRFEPSCSQYALLAVQSHGALRGSLLSAKRLCRCHPFHPGGYDPPPPAPGHDVPHPPRLPRDHLDAGTPTSRGP